MFGLTHWFGHPVTAGLNLYGVGYSPNSSSIFSAIVVDGIIPLLQLSDPGHASVTLTRGPSVPLSRPFLFSISTISVSNSGFMSCNSYPALSVIFSLRWYWFAMSMIFCISSVVYHPAFPIISLMK